jgi:hypothetical protein
VTATTKPDGPSPQLALGSPTLRRWFDSAAVRIPALTVLFSAAALYEAVHLSALADVDIWWHLRTGLWILQNHTLPHYGLFSQSSELPWIASSWAYDVVLAAGYKLMELRALPALQMALEIAQALVLFWLARGSRQCFWRALLLAAAGQLALSGLPSRPVLCSAILFAIELKLIFGARRSGSPRPLFWLPLLFMLWSNLHAGFVYGLAALLLLLVAEIIQQMGRGPGVLWFQNTPRLSVGNIGAVTAASFAAALLTPYAFRLYGVALRTAVERPVYLEEMHAMSFRQPQHYILLLLAMAAFFALGRGRSHDLFQIALMVACLALAFTRQRDIWLLALVSIAVISDAFLSAEQERARGLRWWKWEKLAVAALVALVFLVTAISHIPRSPQTPLDRVAAKFPVRACDYIRAKRLPQPLFNTFDWGGFLTWYLPQYPVSIDSRFNLYGDEFDSLYFKLIFGQLQPDSDPSFARARTILLPTDSPLAVALSALPQFQVAYQDDVAMVLLPVE